MTDQDIEAKIKAEADAVWAKTQSLWKRWEVYAIGVGAFVLGFVVKGLL